MPMPDVHGLTSNEILTLTLAAYAAVVSTSLLIWDVYKWKTSGAKIRLKAAMGYVLQGSPTPNHKKYLSITADNYGDRPTTITNLSGMQYRSWWDAYISKRNPKQAFVFNYWELGQQLPYRLEVGAQFVAVPAQDYDIEQWARNGYLFVHLQTGQGDTRVRLKWKDSREQSKWADRTGA